jgi:hypothetical protein
MCNSVDGFPQMPLPIEVGDQPRLFEPSHAPVQRTKYLVFAMVECSAFCESFNGTFRSECLDTNWFQSLAEAKQLIEAWRLEYNVSRPHRALAERTPAEFASQIAANRDLAETKTDQRLTI